MANSEWRVANSELRVANSENPFAIPHSPFAQKPLASLLGLPVLDGGLFEPIELEQLTVPNRDLLEAFYNLLYYYDEEARAYQRVNYAALDFEELGSVYESLLDNHPDIVQEPAEPVFRFREGMERKSTGSYYTPPELVQELVKSALEPVIEERLEEARRMANGERRMANGEWRMVGTDWKHVPPRIKERFTHVYRERLSRSGSMEAGNVHRTGGLSSHAGVPTGRTVRDDQPASPSSRLDPGEHRGGMGAPLHGGIHSIPSSSQREPHGAGNPADAEQHGGVVPGRGGAAPGDPASGSGQTAPYAGTQPPTEEELAIAWSKTPFAIRYSLFAAEAILSIRVLDPACGSGHFLLAAARRLGRELARVETGEEEPSPEALREAVREVIAHCIYGVDKNPLAVELCKVALWIESCVPGKPLTFLDHRIRCGDSLVGVFDLRVLKEGIPDSAFEPKSGDDKAAAQSARQRNSSERAGQGDLFAEPLNNALLHGAVEALELDAIPDDTVDAITEKARRHKILRHSLFAIRQACNLWTAAFFQELVPGKPVITTDALWRALSGQPVHGQVLGIAEALAEQHRFFHWPLEFPEVFLANSEWRIANSGEEPFAIPHSPFATPFAHTGFDVVLGNPPWEQMQLSEQEFFATAAPHIAAAEGAKRKALIQSLREENPELYIAYLQSLHHMEATRRFLVASGQYPLTARGKINTYSVFAERMRRLLRPGGRAGIIVPTGIATDDTNKFFFGDLVERGELVSLFDFENRQGIFPAVHRSYKFCLLTLRRAGDHAPPAGQSSAIRHSSFAEFAFFLHRASDLADPERRFTLAAEDFRLLNPNTRTAPIFRSRRDAELTKHIYRRVPVLIHEGRGQASNPWGVEFMQGLFNMTSDSHLFRTREELEREGFRLEGNGFVRGEERYLPLYEAKMIHQFDHRFGDYAMQPPGSKSTQLPEVALERLADPNYRVLPRYWVPEAEVEARLRAKGWDRGWLLGWRNITNVTNERTVIAAVIPRVGVGNSYPLILTKASTAPYLAAILSCFPLDYVARQKTGGTNLNFFIFEQLPVLPPDAFDRPLPAIPHSPFATRHSPPTLADFIRPRVLELTYAAWDLAPFARDLG
jgi:hypothetical protein